MKNITGIIFASILILAGFSIAVFASRQQKEYNIADIQLVKLDNDPYKTPQRSNVDFCSICVQLLGQTIEQLENIIANVGVIGGCNKLCSYLDGEGKLVVTACNLVCDYFGIEEFIKLVQKADLDPIWTCKEGGACKVHPCKAQTCAQFNHTNVQPHDGHVGTTFELTTQLKVFDQTGAGEYVFEVIGPVTKPVGGGELVPHGFSPGNYELRAKVETKNEPKKELFWNPGMYQFKMAACEGSCGSDHSYTRTLTETQQKFYIGRESKRSMPYFS